VCVCRPPGSRRSAVTLTNATKLGHFSLPRRLLRMVASLTTQAWRISQAAMVFDGRLGVGLRIHRHATLSQVIKQQLRVFVEQGMVVLERQQIVAALVHDLLGDRRLCPMASMVTTQPDTSNASSKTGMAVISLLFSSTRSWPNTSSCSVAQALSMWMAACPLGVSGASCERRSCLPSMAITSRGSPVARPCTQVRKQSWNCSASSARKTRQKVSCDGMPPGRARKSAQPLVLGLPIVGHRFPIVGATDNGADRDHDQIHQQMHRFIS